MSGTATPDYRLMGRVGFDNLMALREQGEAAISAAGERAVIDLSGLENANSVAVALLMAWFRAARRLEKDVVFLAPPEALVSIVELSGMTEVLPLAEELTP